MSAFLPSKIPNPPNTRWKPDKRNTLFTCDHPAIIWGMDGQSGKFPGAGVDLQEKDNLNGPMDDESYRKPRPTPVVLIDQDSLQAMEPDEYGAELGKEARVWKVYVKETDRWDAELVDGWNRSLDVILVFAALFSAVSTAFLIESTGMLRQDPNDVSAAALLAISQVLLVIANNSSVDLPSSASSIGSEFVPTQHAVLVNSLWYLSLSLSIATSLLAMLAKDWCYSFCANRTGHPWDQALRRQRKWVMIERWKMQELITVLPFLIHLSVLLFAVGLCIRTWEINVTVTIPIICVTGAAFAFYVWSSIMASTTKLFPYTTIISRAIQSDFMHRQYFILRKHWKRCLVQGLAWIPSIVKWTSICLLITLFAVVGVICLPILLLDVLRWLFPRNYIPCGLSDIDNLADIYWLKPPLATVGFLLDWADAEDIYPTIRRAFAPKGVRIEVTEQPVVPSDQDDMTGLALKWMIEYCETPSSITIALQAIAGASSRIPNQPFKSCQATLRILRRLVSGSACDDGSRESGAELYIRALTFLESNSEEDQDTLEKQITDANQDMPTDKRTGDIEVAMWDLKSEHERQVVDLINSTNFRPTQANIAALTIGNSATSLSLRLLKGERNAASRTFNSIMSLLIDHIRHEDQKLDPAALHSLRHAAVLLTSCSEVPLISYDLIKQYLEYSVSYLSTETNQRRHPLHSRPNHPAPKPEIAFVICMLLHPQCAPQTAPASNRSQMRLATRVTRATHLLTHKSWSSSTCQQTLHYVGLLELLFNSERYGISKDEADEYRRRVSYAYYDDELLLSTVARSSLFDPPSSYADNDGVSRFLGTLSHLRELVGAPTFEDSTATCMPPPSYGTLICVTCRTQSEAQQSICKRLLSLTAFPKLDDYFVLGLDPVLTNLWPWEFWRWHRSESVTSGKSNRFSKLARWGTTEAPLKARSRHFAATQTWLFLCLVGDSSTSQQQALKEIVGRKMYQGIGDETIPIHEAKRALEDEIIRSYKKGHHLGAYSARVIECIFESRGEPSDEELARRIQLELKDIPYCIRGLSSFLDRSELKQINSHPVISEHDPSLGPAIARTAVDSPRVSLWADSVATDEDEGANHVAISIPQDVSIGRGEA